MALRPVSVTRTIEPAAVLGAFLAGNRPRFHPGEVMRQTAAVPADLGTSDDGGALIRLIAGDIGGFSGPGVIRTPDHLAMTVSSRPQRRTSLIRCDPNRQSPVRDASWMPGDHRVSRVRGHLACRHPSSIRPRANRRPATATDLRLLAAPVRPGGAVPPSITDRETPGQRAAVVTGESAVRAPVAKHLVDRCFRARWSWGESNPRPSAGGRTCYDHSRHRGCRSLTGGSVDHRERWSALGLSRVSAVFPAVSGLSHRHLPLLLPGCG